MDRISAIRNVEEALREFESGARNLEATEERIRTVVRTYATEFEDVEGGERAVYRAVGAGPADGTIVVASSPAEARDRIEATIDADDSFAVERV